jgi:hypothetical protein
MDAGNHWKDSGRPVADDRLVMYQKARPRIMISIAVLLMMKFMVERGSG